MAAEIDAAPAAVTVRAFETLLAAELPLAKAWNFRVEDIGNGTARIRLPYSQDLLRPGGTVVGPAMMGLADVALYAAVIGRIGLEPMAVTTNLTANFLRRPPPGDLIADCRTIKVGRRLAYGEVTIRREGDPDPVCHVTGTYSIPPQRTKAASAPTETAGANGRIGTPTPRPCPRQGRGAGNLAWGRNAIALFRGSRIAIKAIASLIKRYQYRISLNRPVLR